ncbi:MAG: hypothetical protein ACK5MW_01285 [Enterococcus sp.]
MKKEVLQVINGSILIICTIWVVAGILDFLVFHPTGFRLHVGIIGGAPYIAFMIQKSHLTKLGHFKVGAIFLLIYFAWLQILAIFGVVDPGPVNVPWRIYLVLMVSATIILVSYVIKTKAYEKILKRNT